MKFPKMFIDENKNCISVPSFMYGSDLVNELHDVFYAGEKTDMQKYEFRYNELIDVFGYYPLNVRHYLTMLATAFWKNKALLKQSHNGKACFWLNTNEVTVDKLKNSTHINLKIYGWVNWQREDADDTELIHIQISHVEGENAGLTIYIQDNNYATADVEAPANIVCFDAELKEPNDIYDILPWVFEAAYNVFTSQFWTPADLKIGQII